MAPVKLDINKVKFYLMVLEIADVIEKRIDGVLEWDGELGFLAEIADTPITKRGLKSLKRELRAMLAKARKDAILYKEPKPREMIRSKK